MTYIETVQADRRPAARRPPGPAAAACSSTRSSSRSPRRARRTAPSPGRSPCSSTRRVHQDRRPHRGRMADHRGVLPAWGLPPPAHVRVRPVRALSAAAAARLGGRHRWTCRASWPRCVSWPSRPCPGRELAIAHNRYDRTYTAVARIRVPGLGLADSARRDQRVAGWGGLLAGLCTEGNPIIRVQACQRLVPETGAALRRWHDDHLDPGAPAAAAPSRPNCWPPRRSRPRSGRHTCRS